jgi:hypothetical protein
MHSGEGERGIVHFRIFDCSLWVVEVGMGRAVLIRGARGFPCSTCAWPRGCAERLYHARGPQRAMIFEIIRLVLPPSSPWQENTAAPA